MAERWSVDTAKNSITGTGMKPRPRLRKIIKMIVCYLVGCIPQKVGAVHCGAKNHEVIDCKRCGESISSDWVSVVVEFQKDQAKVYIR